MLEFNAYDTLANWWITEGHAAWVTLCSIGRRFTIRLLELRISANEYLANGLMIDTRNLSGFYKSFNHGLKQLITEHATIAEQDEQELIFKSISKILIQVDSLIKVSLEKVHRHEKTKTWRQIKPNYDLAC